LLLIFKKILKHFVQKWQYFFIRTSVLQLTILTKPMHLGIAALLKVVRNVLNLHVFHVFVCTILILNMGPGLARTLSNFKWLCMPIALQYIIREISLPDIINLVHLVYWNYFRKSVYLSLSTYLRIFVPKYQPTLANHSSGKSSPYTRTIG